MVDFPNGLHGFVIVHVEVGLSEENAFVIIQFQHLEEAIVLVNINK